jgi:hypothetical protein
MRDFKEPYYDGPDCVCCDSVKKERQRINDRINELLAKAEKTHTPIFGDIGLKMALEVVNELD